MSKKPAKYIIELKRRWADCVNIQYCLDLDVNRKGFLYDPLGYYKDEKAIITCFSGGVTTDEDFSPEEEAILKWNTGIEPLHIEELYDEGLLDV